MIKKQQEPEELEPLGTEVFIIAAHAITNGESIYSMPKVAKAIDHQIFLDEGDAVSHAEYMTRTLECNVSVFRGILTLTNKVGLKPRKKRMTESHRDPS